jgi:hypothetical protein
MTADNIKLDLQEIGFWGMEWIGLAQVAGTCECGNENAGNFLTSCKPVSFSGRTLLHGVCK